MQALAQTRDGYLWLGTQAGLVRFDGVRFTTYDHSASPALDRPYIWSLAADEDGSLWIGTEETGLIHYHDGQFTRFGKAQGLPSAWVSVILHHRAGNLWVGTTGGGLRACATAASSGWTPPGCPAATSSPCTSTPRARCG